VAPFSRLVAAVHMIAPPNLPEQSGHYSHAISHAGLVYVSGQLPWQADGSPATGLDFAQQAARVFEQVDQVLHKAGSGRAQLLKVTVYVTDISHWPLFNALYANWLGDHRPARTVVPVPVLHYGLLLELDAVAWGPV
jgi:2-iminobutanoate/2-iminopropanoate deaminase